MLYARPRAQGHTRGRRYRRDNRGHRRVLGRTTTHKMSTVLVEQRKQSGTHTTRDHTAGNPHSDTAEMIANAVPLLGGGDERTLAYHLALD